MGVRESLLNTITSVADSDFVRIVTSAGASSKATVRNLFKGFESNLSAKSSLTDSDYIRVVGSDNEAYKQSFSDVVDQTLSAYPGLTATTDVTAWAAERNGFGITTTNLNTANLPSASTKYGVAWCNNNNHGTNIWCNLFWSPTGTTDIYVRQKTNAGAWSAWEKLPTRAEIDALKTASNITPTSYTASSSINIRSFSIYRSGNVVNVNLYFDVTTALSNNNILVSFANALPLPCGAYSFTAIRSIGGNVGSVSLERTDAAKIKAWGAVPVGTYYYAQLVYITA